SQGDNRRRPKPRPARHAGLEPIAAKGLRHLTESIDVIAALPVLAAARVLVQLEWHAVPLPWRTGLGRALDRDRLIRGCECQPQRDVLHEDGSRVTKVPEITWMCGPVRVRQTELQV